MINFYTAGQMLYHLMDANIALWAYAHPRTICLFNMLCLSNFVEIQPLQLLGVLLAFRIALEFFQLSRELHEIFKEK